ncbi:MAG: hypothetical protein GY765_16830 [bacterium]|nr:hypothetical protein [bacterium]
MEFEIKKQPVQITHIAFLKEYYIERENHLQESFCFSISVRDKMKHVAAGNLPAVVKKWGTPLKGNLIFISRV